MTAADLALMTGFAGVPEDMRPLLVLALVRRELEQLARVAKG